MYKPPKPLTRKILRLIAPPKIGPQGGLYLENCPQIQSKTKQNSKFTSEYKVSPINYETQISLCR